MISKLRLILLALMTSICLNAQEHGCATGAPSQQWDDWFNKQVEDFVKRRQTSKTQLVNYTIPVIVHIIHFGEAIGTYPNIDSNQVKSQILALNNDFAGNGYNVSSLPAAFAHTKANTGIQFCLASKDYTGTTMLERGIHRVSAAANNWKSPGTPTLNLQAYFNSVVIPATIWDPTRYFNIWVSDKPPAQTYNGFATYPSGTPLIGLFGGSYGTATNDGIWIYAKAFGTTGAAQAPFDKGRTCTHETGHWLGLRHIWGDGNCLSDYVNDTPWSKAAHTGCVPVPTPIDICGVSQSPNGEMPFNFMDMSDDACKYMFTVDQTIRMQTALNTCPNRYLLGTHNICIPTPTPASTASASASFNMMSNACVNIPFMPFNTSSGYPNPTYLWTSSPAAIFSPANNVANPQITFGTAGTYTLQLVATNSLSSSTYTMAVTTSFSCTQQQVCLDTLRMIRNLDTLTVYNAPVNPQVALCMSGSNLGFLTGTNCFKDKEFAQYFPPSTYTSIPYPQVNSAIVLFDSAGTKGSGQIVCRVVGGNASTGPVATLGTPRAETYATILATTKTTSISYMGKQGYVVPNRKIIPYRFDFAQPVVITTPSSGFFVSVVAPPYTAVYDSVRIFSNTKTFSGSDSSAWFMSTNGTWRTFRYNRGAKIQLAIMPQITCSPLQVGVKEVAGVLASNISIMPNPSNGVFSVIFTLPQMQESLTMNIYNAFGQLISSETLGYVSNSAFDIDLSSKPDGIYFTEITNGSEKVVKKLVLTR